MGYHSFATKTRHFMEFIEGKWANDDFFCRFHLSDFQGPVLTVCNAVQYRSTPAIWIGILFTMAACTADSPPQRRHQPVAISQLLVASGQYQSPAAGRPQSGQRRPSLRNLSYRKQQPSSDLLLQPAAAPLLPVVQDAGSFTAVHYITLYNM